MRGRPLRPSAMGRSPRFSIAMDAARELRRREGRNLVAAPRNRRGTRPRILRGPLLAVHQLTPAEAREEVAGSGPWLNDALGGWRSMRALHDPTRLIARLRE